MAFLGRYLMKVNTMMQTVPAWSSKLTASTKSLSAFTEFTRLKSSLSLCETIASAQHLTMFQSTQFPVAAILQINHCYPNSRNHSSESKSYDPQSPYKNPGPRRYGYETKILTGGVLPRLENSRHRLPIPTYIPKDFWTKKKALFGQNDYIDILGDGDVHPADLIKGPVWLIGFRGNELQRLIRRMHFQGNRMKWMYPTKYHQMRKRIWFLYKKYNQKRPRGMGT